MTTTKNPDQLLSARIASLGFGKEPLECAEIHELVLMARELEKTRSVNDSARFLIRDALAITAGWLMILIKREPDFVVSGKTATELLVDVNRALEMEFG